MFDLGTKIAADIAQYGWSALGVFGTEDNPQPPFTYTIGLTQRNLPEIIVFGLSAPIAHGLISKAISDYSEQLTSECRLDAIIAGFPAWIRSIDKQLACEQFLVQAAHYYGRVVDVVQLIWPDQQGRFPWDHGVNPTMATVQSPLGSWSNPLH